MSASENNPSRQELIPANVLALEQARIDNANRQVEARRELTAANDRNNQRLFEFHTNRLEREMKLLHARHKTYKVVVYAVVLATVATIWFLLYNAFYGDGEQREYGLMIAKYLAIGVAGYGIISGVAGLFKKFLKQGEE
ncbi:MAG: hypothetical protein OXU41_02145 [Gammaproteobacteria bacterium]|nr:hypothetical protein [Gammaproteobacteria bacterium]MDD9870320.1 hypothetical protein [Gammaproteobacteria bacterium]